MSVKKRNYNSKNNAVAALKRVLDDFVDELGSGGFEEIFVFYPEEDVLGALLLNSDDEEECLMRYFSWKQNK